MDSRKDLSDESLFAIVIESALTPMVTSTPIIKMMICERRLYQPETRSIELLYQSSMFCRAMVTSFPAASTRAIKACRTWAFGRFCSVLRSASRGLGAGGDGGAGTIPGAGATLTTTG